MSNVISNNLMKPSLDENNILAKLKLIENKTFNNDIIELEDLLYSECGFISENALHCAIIDNLEEYLNYDVAYYLIYNNISNCHEIIFYDSVKFLISLQEKINSCNEKEYLILNIE